jgi:hypothetical protein
MEYDEAQRGREGSADSHAQSPEKILAVEKFFDFFRVAHRARGGGVKQGRDGDWAGV